MNAVIMEERVKIINLTTTLCTYEGLGAAELMIGFWFGIGAILAVKMVHSLEYCIEELIGRK